MREHKVTRHNLAPSLDSALLRCRAELDAVNKEQGNPALLRDLKYGLQSLELIHAELEGGEQRPKGQRSASFLRYVIDEEPNIVMKPELRELIIAIEDVYSRY
ncbi:MAG: hypothetical protein NTW37_15270 [Proteobacteria bacterium]|nr:hypothetical protein [Pseudomonadota bacterium]